MKRFCQILIFLAAWITINATDYHFRETSLANALAEISSKEGISISYKSSEVASAPKVTARISGQTPLETIKVILPPNLQAKVIGNIIVITSTNSKIEDVVPTAPRKTRTKTEPHKTSTEVRDVGDSIIHKTTTYIRDTLYEYHTMALPTDTVLYVSDIADYITPYLKVGYGSLLYNKATITTGNVTYGGGIEYHHFLNKNWGIGTGVGLKSICARFTYPDTEATEPDITDSEGESYTRTTSISGYNDKFQSLYLDIPVTAVYKLPLSYNIDLWISASFVLGVPILGEHTVMQGTETVSGYYPQWDLLLHDMPEHGFGTTDLTGEKHSEKPGITYGANIEINATFRMTPSASIQASLFGEYCYGAIYSNWSAGLKVGVPLKIK